MLLFCVIHLMIVFLFFFFRFCTLDAVTVLWIFTISSLKSYINPPVSLYMWVLRTYSILFLLEYFHYYFNWPQSLLILHPFGAILINWVAISHCSPETDLLLFMGGKNGRQIAWAGLFIPILISLCRWSQILHWLQQDFTLFQKPYFYRKHVIFILLDF